MNPLSPASHSYYVPLSIFTHKPTFLVINFFFCFLTNLGKDFFIFSFPFQREETSFVQSWMGGCLRASLTYTYSFLYMEGENGVAGREGFRLIRGAFSLRFTWKGLENCYCYYLGKPIFASCLFSFFLGRKSYAKHRNAIE